MARKKKPHELSSEETIAVVVNDVLSAKAVTPRMILDLLYCGYRVYRSDGPSREQVIEAVLDGFAANGRVYMRPGQIASLGLDPWTEGLLDHLKE